MDKRLSAETEAALRDLAREIGEARGLDDEAREELFGHLEDKTLGYLSGEEGLSEAEAVVLTREHFGDSIRLEQTLRRPPRSFHKLSMVQRLLMVACVTFVFGNLLQRSTMNVMWTILGFDLPLLIVYVLAVLLCSGMATWSLAVAAGFVLRWWERHVLAGTAFRIDLSRSKHLALVVGIGVFLLLSIAIPLPGQHKASPTAQAVSSALVGSLSWLIIASTIAWPLLWMWWFDRRSGHIKNIAVGAVSWIGFRLVLSLLPFLISGPGSMALQGTARVSVSHPLMMLVYRPFVMHLPMLLAQAGVAFALYLVYAAWRDGIHLRPVKAKPAVR